MVPPRWQPLVQLVLARIREFYREPEVLFWVYGFPLLLAIGLGVAFAGSAPQPPAVDIVDGPGAERLRLTLADEFEVAVHPEAECRSRLVKGKTALYLHVSPDTGKLQYVFDEKRADSFLARQWVEAALLRSRAGPAEQPEDVKIDEPGSRYIDFLLPGLVGANLMGGGLFGIGFLLVDMRVRKLFKRLLATPLRRSDFLLSILTSRLLFLLPEMLALLVVARLLFGVPVNGSVLLLALVIFLGAAAFAGLGLLLACRTDKLETISAYINGLMMPMYVMSGVFFPSSKFPVWLQPLVQALPLTHLNDALRAVMLEGAGITDIALQLAILTAWAVVCFALALRWFRWL
jgi:ABC-type multidrug transport system permease subunit